MPIKLNSTIRHVAGVIVFVAGLAATTLGQERDRSKIPEHYKWDLTALYPTDQAWRSQKEKLVAELPRLREFQKPGSWLSTRVRSSREGVHSAPSVSLSSRP